MISLPSTCKTRPWPVVLPSSDRGTPAFAARCRRSASLAAGKDATIRVGASENSAATTSHGWARFEEILQRENPDLLAVDRDDIITRRMGDYHLQRG